MKCGAHGIDQHTDLCRRCGHACWVHANFGAPHITNSCKMDDCECPGWVAPITEEEAAAAATLGRLGASKGGLARSKKLSKKRRSEIARAGGKKRWANAKAKTKT